MRFLLGLLLFVCAVPVQAQDLIGRVAELEKAMKSNSDELAAIRKDLADIKASLGGKFVSNATDRYKVVPRTEGVVSLFDVFDTHNGRVVKTFKILMLAESYCQWLNDTVEEKKASKKCQDDDCAVKIDAGYRKALAEGKFLVVWCGCPCINCVKKMPDYVHVTCDCCPECCCDGTPCIKVYHPVSLKDAYLVTLPAGSSVEKIRAAFNPPCQKCGMAGCGCGCDSSGNGCSCGQQMQQQFIPVMMGGCSSCGG